MAYKQGQRCKVVKWLAQVASKHEGAGFEYTLTCCKPFSVHVLLVPARVLSRCHKDVHVWLTGHSKLAMGVTT